MPGKTISQMTKEMVPDAQSLIEISTPAPNTRSTTLEIVRKRPIGEPISMAEGTNGASGTGTLASGTAVISTTKVTANSRIYVFPQETGTITGILRVSARTAGTSFTVSSSVNTDTVKFAWMIIEP